MLSVFFNQHISIWTPALHPLLDRLLFHPVQTNPSPSVSRPVACQQLTPPHSRACKHPASIYQARRDLCQLLCECFELALITTACLSVLGQRCHAHHRRLFKGLRMCLQCGLTCYPGGFQTNSYQSDQEHKNMMQFWLLTACI